MDNADKFKVGGEVKVIIPQFVSLYKERNVWVIDHVRETRDGIRLYLCYNKHDKRQMLFYFLQHDLEALE